MVAHRPRCWRARAGGAVGSPAFARRGTRKSPTAAAAHPAGECRPLLGRRAGPEAHGPGLPGRAGRQPRTPCPPRWPIPATARSSWMPPRWARPVRHWSSAQPEAPEACGSSSLGSPGGAGETAYRKHKIFYYAVEPFSDNEIADILMGAFQTREVQPPRPIGRKSLPSRSAGSPSPTATCTRWSCWRRRGCCGPTRGRRADRPTAAGADVARGGHARRSVLTPANIFKTAAGLRPGDGAPRQRHRPPPGSLAHDTKPDFDVDPGEHAPARWRS